jgi:hypothetical protein
MKPFRKVVPALALMAIVAVVAVLTFHPAPVAPQAVTAVVTAPASAPSSPPVDTRGPVAQPTVVSTPASHPEPGLDGFRRWAEEFARACIAERRTLVDEGRKLVAERRRAMQDLIREDPRSAIAQALPYGLREALPADIAGLIEHPVRARGDLSVMGAFGGDASAPRASYERVVHVGGRDY